MAPRYTLDEKIALATQLRETFGDTVTRQQILDFRKENNLPRRPHWILNDKAIRSARAVYNMVDVLNMLEAKRDGGEQASTSGEATNETSESFSTQSEASVETSGSVE